uniref:flavin reductase n=1 Tax=uncultured Rhizobium sp. TaxID=155567 RepID=UPI002615F47B|nr:flavin reductase [uncultured Rhizobium sp.]
MTMMTEPHAEPSAIGSVLVPVTRETYRDGMASFAAAVNVIASYGPAGLAGFTATAVTSVTDDPPTLLVCLNRKSSAAPAVLENGVVSVNALAPGHEAVSALFGGKTPMADRFAAARWTYGKSGAPLLEDALVSFDCTVTETVEVGTHIILMCQVIDVCASDRQEALVYFKRAYQAVCP